MVVIYHLTNQTSRLGLRFPDVTVLASGVDIFFVISGFIMWVTTAPRPQKTSVSFLRDRVARIVPLYWAVTSVVVLLLILVPNAFVTTVWDTNHIIKSLFFIPAIHPRTGHYEPTLIPGWTLNLEMFFYVVFAVSMAIGGRSIKARAVIVLVSLGCLVGLGVATSPDGILSFYTFSLIGEFEAGIGIGIVYLSVLRLPYAVGWLLLIAGCGGLLFTAVHPLGLGRAVEWGIPASAIVAGAVFGGPMSVRPLEQLGNWSYALYLTHLITLAASQRAWAVAFEGLPLLLFPFVAVVACVAVSALTYEWVERPLTARAKRILSSTSE
jgi:exopolysaccharide production protein ExoZ